MLYKFLKNNFNKHPFASFPHSPSRRHIFNNVKTRIRQTHSDTYGSSFVKFSHPEPISEEISESFAVRVSSPFKSSMATIRIVSTKSFRKGGEANNIYIESIDLSDK